MRYSTFLKRKETATPYANQANCRKCAYGEYELYCGICEIEEDERFVIVDDGKVTNNCETD